MKSPNSPSDQLTVPAPTGETRGVAAVMGCPVSESLLAGDAPDPTALATVWADSADSDHDAAALPTPARPYRSVLVDALMERLREARTKRFHRH